MLSLPLRPWKKFEPQIDLITAIFVIHCGTPSIAEFRVNRRAEVVARAKPRSACRSPPLSGACPPDLRPCNDKVPSVAPNGGCGFDAPFRQ